jgi:glucosamine--fructose-6-phosphate aminotransferase (isomerizing)
MKENSRSGAITRNEIASQPECWETALRRATTGVAGLPQNGERVLLLGCGTSYYVGEAYARLRESVGKGVSDALVASDLVPVFRSYDRVLAISRSGTSSELLGAVEQFRTQQPGVPVVALLGEQGTPLAAVSDVVVDLSFADEVSVVQTRFPTTLLMLLRAALDDADLDYVQSLPQRAKAALVGPLPDINVRQVVFLGHGWAAPIAQEAALKVRESAGTWVEAYPVGEYRHGPIATCAPGTLVWGLDQLPQDMVSAIEDSGGRVENGCGEPLVELVRAHRFAVSLAAANDRDPDQPARLSRSVVLPSR